LALKLHQARAGKIKERESGILFCLLGLGRSRFLWSYNNPMTNSRVERDGYDPHIIPSESGARKDREGEAYKHKPKEDASGVMDTSGGYTVDQEGLVNNYAIEPEMYINEPGDLREEQEAEEARRRAELQAINQNDETGKLTPGSDQRGKGPGVV
jgi:hypothetical protein